MSELSENEFETDFVQDLNYEEVEMKDVERSER